MSEPTIRVVVADDQAIVREGLATVLDLLPDVEVVAQAADGEQACLAVERTSPDVVLMDLRMPVLDGTAATARILAAHPETAVLVLTTYADDASVAGALRAGARGYLTKDASRAEVAAAIRAVARGQTTLAAEVGARLVEGLVGRSADDPVRSLEPVALRARFTSLTAREAEVLALVATGRNNAEIAGDLFIGVATVKSHINVLFAKLGVRDRAQAIALARGPMR
ncbi:response regulator [Microbacterium sp.]|uniref:response regulator n=1 Tax=Microbacterium sp. TaxID=51671 RepID=UPI0039E610A4